MKIIIFALICGFFQHFIIFLFNFLNEALLLIIFLAKNSHKILNSQVKYKELIKIIKQCVTKFHKCAQQQEHQRQNFIGRE